MSGINVMRSWGDDVLLAAQRAEESTAALAALRGDAGRLDEALHAISNGSTWDDPFDAALELAEGGNRGLWDGWSKADAAHTILTRAVRSHPGGEGAVQLQRATSIAEQASGDIGNFIATGGRHGTFEGLEAAVRSQLDEVRELAAQVQPRG